MYKCFERIWIEQIFPKLVLFKSHIIKHNLNSILLTTTYLKISVDEKIPVLFLSYHLRNIIKQ